MHTRLLVLVFVGSALLFGAAFAAHIFEFPGTQSPIVMSFSGGSSGSGQLAFGSTLVKRPDWVPVMPKARILDISLETSELHPKGFGILTTSSGAKLEAIRAYYARALASGGFRVRDVGISPLNPASANYLGVGGTILAERADTKDCIAVQITTPQGLILASRIIKIMWFKSDALLVGAPGKEWRCLSYGNVTP